MGKNKKAIRNTVRILYYAQINLAGLHTDKRGHPIKLYNKGGGYWDHSGHYGDIDMQPLDKTIISENYIRFYSFDEKKVQIWIDGAASFRSIIGRICKP